MRLPDGSILMHRMTDAYDPAKAHAYYLRTRKLKGRRKGRAEQLSTTGAKKVGSSSTTYTVKLNSGQAIKLTGKQLVEQQVYAAKRINNIKKSLAELGTRLKMMMAETRREIKKSPTVADKSKAARESKQYRDKHKQEISTKRKTKATKESTESERKEDAIVELEKKINEVKGRLTAAVAKQRSLAAAIKNR